MSISRLTLWGEVEVSFGCLPRELIGWDRDVCLVCVWKRIILVMWGLLYFLEDRSRLGFRAARQLCCSSRIAVGVIVEFLHRAGCLQPVGSRRRKGVSL